MFIGVQQDAGPIVTVAFGAADSGVFADAFGEFESVAIVGLGQPFSLPLLLNSTSIAENTAGAADAGTLSVYVTSTDNAAPLGALPFTSEFTVGDLALGWTETLEAYLDVNNGIFALTTLLGSSFFNTTDIDTSSTVVDPGPGPYSVTAVYRITAPSIGDSSATVALSASEARSVPETSILGLIGLGIAALGLARRRT